MCGNLMEIVERVGRSEPTEEAAAALRHACYLNLYAQQLVDLASRNMLLDPKPITRVRLRDVASHWRPRDCGESWRKLVYL